MKLHWLAMLVLSRTSLSCGGSVDGEEPAACEAWCSRSEALCGTSDCLPECESLLEAESPCDKIRIRYLNCVANAEETSLECWERKVSVTDESCLDEARSLLRCIDEHGPTADALSASRGLTNPTEPKSPPRSDGSS
jgi:hypothetical protein